MYYPSSCSVLLTHSRSLYLKDPRTCLSPGQPTRGIGVTCKLHLENYIASQLIPNDFLLCATQSQMCNVCITFKTGSYQMHDAPQVFQAVLSVHVVLMGSWVAQRYHHIASCHVMSSCLHVVSIMPSCVSVIPVMPYQSCQSCHTRGGLRRAGVSSCRVMLSCVSVIPVVPYQLCQSCHTHGELRRRGVIMSCQSWHSCTTSYDSGRHAYPIPYAKRVLGCVYQRLA